MKNKSLIGFLALGLCFYSAKAQQNPPQDKNVYNESVIVVGGYQPVLLDVFRKINENPFIFDTVYKTPELNYQFNQKQYHSIFKPEPIKAAKIVGEPIPRLYRNYAKLGMGTYLSPLAEFYFNTTRSRNTIVGAYVQHYSSWWSLDNTGKSTFANTELDVFGKYLWKKNVLSADVFYTNNYYHFYGFNPNQTLPVLGIEDLDASKYKQSYNRFGFNLEHKSYNAGEDKWQHLAKITFADMMDVYGSNQMDVKAFGDMHKTFSFWGAEKQILGMDARLDLDRTLLNAQEHVITVDTNYVIPEWFDDNATQGIFGLHPYFNFSIAGFQFDAGFHFELGFAEETTPYFYPDIKVSKSFMDEILNVYAGISGELTKNSLNSLRLQNPYISNTVEKKFTNNNLNLFAGFVANPSKQFDIQGKILYGNYRDMVLFGLDERFSLQNVYKPIYDDAGRFEAGLQMGYEYDSKLKVTIGGHYYHVAMETEPEAWYLPNFDCNILLRYKIGTKFVAGLEAKFVGPVKGFEFDAEGNKQILEMSGRYDMSLSVDYFYNKSLRFFWLLNNITNQRYYNWAHYPTQKFNTMLGLSYSF